MSDTKEIITCPACGHLMKKIYIPSAGVNVDLCSEGCGGIFFDNRELDKFDSETDDISAIVDSLRDRSFEITDETLTRTCPICNTPMVKFGAGGGELRIDVCNVCGGKFLDHGELEKIRKHDESKNNRILDTLFKKFDDNYSSRQREIIEKAAGYYLSKD